MAVSDTPEPIRLSRPADFPPRDSPIVQMVRDLVDRQQRAVAAAVERACEEALQTGVCGVAIVHDGTTTLVGQWPGVPYGMIYDYPTMAAFTKAAPGGVAPAGGPERPDAGT